MANISVIIPCYNVSPYIDRCLTSITSQTIGVEALEIICVDDASTDDTLKKLQTWEQRYPENILLVHCDENGKLGTARNIGMRYATAPWVGFIDSDDWIEPDYFEQLYQIIGQVECDVVCCQNERDPSTTLSYLENRDTSRENRYMVIDTIEKRKIFFVFNSMASFAWGKLIRRNLLVENQIYFPEGLTYEDTYWSSLLHLYTSKAYIIEKKLYHYFINQNSIVLQKDSDHHVDLLTVQSMLWREWKNRGFFAAYKEELEYCFLRSCYLSFLKVIVLRYQFPSYSLFLLAKETVLERIPDYLENTYVKGETLSDYYRILLQSLSLPLTKAQFEEFAKDIKAIGI